MGLMTSELNSIIRDNEKDFGTGVDQIMLKTGFASFDHLNGQMEFTAAGQKKFNVGIDSGKAIMIVGKAGSGKTTFAVQMMLNAMQRFNESTAYIMDFEGASSMARVKAITGLSDEYLNEHLTIKKVGIYTESVLKLVKQIDKFKTEHRKELLVDDPNGTLDSNGNVRKMLPPTFILVDSLAAMAPKEVLTSEDIPSLTVGGRNAIANNGLMKTIMQPCLNSNIVVIFINHITTNIGIGPTPVQAINRYMGQSEAVSGGKGTQYYVNLWVKIEAKEKIEKDKDKYGIKGFRANVVIIKSRNASGGSSIPMIFNQEEGFDEDLTMFEFLSDNKVIQGAGVGLYLPGLETKKFRASNFKEKLQDPEFKAVWDELCKASLENFVEANSSRKLKQEAASEELETLEALNISDGEQQ